MIKNILILSILIFNVYSFGSDIEIGTYNLQNMFDSEHDEGKFDYEFLPKDSQVYVEYFEEKCKNPKNDWDERDCKNPRHNDWTEDKVALKISQAARVIQSRGALPNILVVEEIENKNVASMLAKELGYGKNFYITESGDKRGIDIAIFYKEKAKTLRFTGEIQEHFVPVDQRFATRPILEVKFEIYENGKWKPLIIFGNHWPSQFAPNSKPRLIAAKALKEAIDEALVKDPNAYIMALGDFNTTEHGSKDIPHPFRDELFVDSDLFDVHVIYTLAVAQNIIDDNQLVEGTYYFGKDILWHRLDRFFVSSNLLDGEGANVDLQSYDIYSPGFLRKEFVTKNYKTNEILATEASAPFGYRYYTTDPEKAGFSDHFPIFVKLEF